MIRIKYEEYTNDFTRRFLEKQFAFMEEFENWFFNLCDGEYSRNISIPDPKRCAGVPYRMEVNCVRTQNKCYWVHQIEWDNKIVFSDGRYTSGQKHWNEWIKQLCERMIARKDNPKFNFG